ncbi:MAG: hypothetical protein ABJF23_17645 [Bryobacteraceae bacterium]
MPFCTQCGNQVGGRDVFCGKCGTRQATPPAGPPPPVHGNAFLGGISSRSASMLCYIPVIGWIPSIFVLAADRFQHDRTVRFHAFQGLYLFVVWLLVDWVVSPIFSITPGFHEGKVIRSLLHTAVFGAWVFMLIKTSQHQVYRLPIVGELADRSVAEQR